MAKNLNAQMLAAADNGNVQKIKRLLAAGVDIEYLARDGASALRMAVLSEHLEIVNVLLAAGANPNAPANSDMTPLHLASGNGHAEILQALLAAGANVDTAISGETPLHSPCFQAASTKPTP